MENWNVASVSKEFEQKAALAERYLIELDSKVARNPSYEMIYDETLANFWIYNYLHGRTFLESKASLLSELCNLRSQSAKPSRVFSMARFENARLTLVNRLIERFERPT